MSQLRLIITGGAGFVGSNLAIRFRETLVGCDVTIFDNLRRRGSELNLPRLRSAGAKFIHGDVRCVEDLAVLPDFDVLIDCAAEPSVHAGACGAAQFVLNNNLVGTLNCFELVRSRRAALMLLSTSRVYPIAGINALCFSEEATRFRLEACQAAPGVSDHGIGESFALDGPRSFYGASKLAAELVLQEYVHATGMPAIINRCGVVAGPWQMGKADQGVVTLWVARHYFQQPLQYIGFGGAGKQVRDLLHIDDLFELIASQIRALSKWNGAVYNIGGGMGASASLLELTGVCRSITGRRVPITPVPETSPVDVRVYVSDARKAQRDFGWQAERGVEQISEDIYKWIDRHCDLLQPILAC